MSTLEVKELAAPTGFDLKIASGETLDLKSQGTVTMPTGSVLQVVHVVDTTRVTISATSFTAVHISAAITPISTSSKILIHLNFGINDNTTSDVTGFTTIYRGSTNLGNSTSGFAKLRCTSARMETMQSIMYLDSPATTSATTYSLYARAASGAFEFPGAAGMPTTITLMEVSA